MIWSPAVFWLIPLALAALLWIRFFRTRKQELLTGSLLVWKRLAAQQPLKPPRRFELDRSLLLQAASIIALIAAIAHPRLQALPSSGRVFVIAVDNGPLSRFMDANGQPVWNSIKNDAQTALKTLAATDRVLLIRAAPAPKALSAESVSRTEALKHLDLLQPALSGPNSTTLLEFARNAARTLNQNSAAVFSASAAPSPEVNGAQWFCSGGKLDGNVGFVAFGATPVSKEGANSAQVLARVHNAGSRNWKGTVVAEQAESVFNKTLDIPAGQDREVFLDHARADVPLTLKIEATDAFAEDNRILAQPRASAPLSVRFHSSMPALEKLFASAIQARRIPIDSIESADLEIYRGTPPQQLPPKAKALLLIEPSSGYRFFFDVGDATLKNPRVVRDEVSALTDKFDNPGEAGLFPVGRAAELLRTGPYTSLLKDAKSQRTLAARFVDEQDRPGYVLAFTPGEGAAPEALLPPELATLLIRIAREASGAGDLFQVEMAATKEAQSNEPLPPGDLAAVLDERISTLQPGAKTAAQFDSANFSQASQRAALDLRPLLVLLALVLIGIDFVLARRSSLAPARA